MLAERRRWPAVFRQRMEARPVEQRACRVEQALRTWRVEHADDRGVKRFVEVVESRHVVVANRRRLLVQVLIEPLQQLPIRLLRYTTHGLHFEPSPDQQGLPHIFRTDWRDEAAALRIHVHEPLFSEPRDRLAHWRPRYTELHGDFVFLQP